MDRIGLSARVFLRLFQIQDPFSSSNYNADIGGDNCNASLNGKSLYPGNAYV